MDLKRHRQIRQFNKKIPIIAQTAFFMEIDPEKCLAQAATNASQNRLTSGNSLKKSTVS